MEADTSPTSHTRPNAHALKIWPGTPILPEPSFFNVDYRRISGSVKRITYIIVL